MTSCASSRSRSASSPASARSCIGGAPEGGGAALVAAVANDSGLNASELIADAAKTVQGGAGKSADVAVAGGKDPSKLDEALALVRAAAGSVSRVRVLALDLGSKRIGVAVSDPTESIATPDRVIAAHRLEGARPQGHRGRWWRSGRPSWSWSDCRSR